MITILFISDDTRVAGLIARFQPQLKARLRLAHDFDQGLKEVFDNRPAAVFIQGAISGVSGETVARHIKSLLRADAPHVVLIHTSPSPVQGSKKWFDDAVDLTLPQAELDDQCRQRLMEFASDQWVAGGDVQAPPSETVSGAHAVDVPVEVPLPPEEFKFSDWEPSVTEGAVGVTPSLQSGPDENELQDGLPLSMSPEPSIERNSVSPGQGMPPSVPEPRVVTTSIIEESSAAQLSASEGASPSPVSSPPAPMTPPREPPPKAPPSVQLSQSRDPDGSEVRATPSLAHFSAEQPGAEHPEWVTIPPPDKEFGGTSGRRISIVAVALVVLLIGAVTGGYFLLKGKGGGNKPGSAVKSAAKAPVTVPPSSAPPAPPKAYAAETLPSFVPVSGRDAAFGNTHPGWERYRGEGAEFRLFRENGRLKVVQVIALRGKPIPETYVARIVRELTGSENRTVASQANKGGYRREVGRVAGNGEIVIYRKGDGIRGVVITLG